MRDEKVAGAPGAMDEVEIDAFLREQGAGVLSLAADGEAYAVPLSFGYDTGRALFAYYTFGVESRKKAFTEATERACLAVQEVRGEDDWTSVLARGPLHELDVDEWDDLGATIDANAWSPDLSGLGDRRLAIDGYELRIETATGLRVRPDDR